MGTGTKLAVLTGAAAVYYMYKKHQNAKGTGVTGQYYRSKNGSVYYRDQNGKSVWVQPPAGGIQVPAAEAEVHPRAPAIWPSDEPYGPSEARSGRARPGRGCEAGP